MRLKGLQLFVALAMTVALASGLWLLRTSVAARDRPPRSVRGRRGRVGGEACDGGGNRHLAPRRKCGRRRSSGGSGARCHRAVLVRHRWRRVLRHPDCATASRDDRRAGDCAGGDAPTRSGRTACRCRSTRRDTAGFRRGARHARTWVRRSRSSGRCRLRRRCSPASGSRVTATSSTRRSFDRSKREPRLVRRYPRERRAVPRPGRDAARRRHGVPQPATSRDVRADRSPRRRKASTAARSRTRSSKTVQHPAVGPRRITCGAPA